MYSLKQYAGDERIKQFIYDLIKPNQDGKQLDLRKHSGNLSIRAQISLSFNNRNCALLVFKGIQKGGWVAIKTFVAAPY